MCLGVPLRVTAVTSPASARCVSSDNAEDLREVNTGLLDEPPREGDWLLVHVDMAIRSLTPTEARQIGDALQAVTAAAAGEPWEHLIADLVDREPELPEHLRPATLEEHGHG